MAISVKHRVGAWALGLIWALPVMAQTAVNSNTQPQKSADDQSKLSEVVVTGVRESVESEQAIKENSLQVQDSIVAEDIGKFPDNSTADALQRVPGVQIRRDADEASVVLVRGLPNVVTLLNGREIFTTTTGVPPAGGRFAALSDIPAPLLQRVDTYKSNSPDLVEGGIAGTIDVRLHRPFDFQGLEVAGTAQARYEGNSAKTDPLGSLLVSDRWNTGAGEFGALLSVSFQQQRYEEDRIFNFLQLPSPYSVPGSNPAVPYTFPQTVGGFASPGDRKRPAANYSLQWRPSDSLELYAEGFYSENRSTYFNDYFIGIPVASAPVSYTLFPGTNAIHTYTGTNAFTLTSTQAYRLDAETWQSALGGKWDAGDLHLKTDLALTHSFQDFRDTILDTRFNAPTLSANFNAGSGTPNVTISGVDVTNGSNFFLNQLFDDRDQSIGSSIAWRLDESYDLGSRLFSSLDSGIRIENRKASYQASLGDGTPIDPNTVISAASVPGLGGMSPPNFFGGRMGVPQWFESSGYFLLNNTDTLRQIFGRPLGAPDYVPSRAFNDTEKSYALYISTKFGTELGSLPLDGILGGRLVRTDQSLGAFEQSTVGASVGPAVPVSVDKSNTDFLPSVNARLKLQPDLILRATANRVVTRPDFPSLNPTATFTTAGPTLIGSGTGGNANLDEVKSSNFDLSLEWYFAKVGSLTETLFYRDLKGYIQLYSDPETIDGSTYIVTRPHNTGTGHLFGGEIAYQQFYDFLPGWLRGFGTQINYTYINATTQSPLIDPTTQVPTSNGTGIRVQQDLVNVSRNSLNVVGIYELNGFSARLAYNWRSSFVDSYSNGGGLYEPTTVIAKPVGQLDFSGYYDVTKDFTVTVDAANLLNYKYQDYFGNSYVFPRDTRRYDRTFLVGVRFRL